MARTKVKKERVLTKTEEKRKAHYPETSTFHWYNANQKGKLDGDCVFRAMATVLDTTWEEVVRDMCEMSIKTGYCIKGRKNIAASKKYYFIDPGLRNAKLDFLIL